MPKKKKEEKDTEESIEQEEQSICAHCGVVVNESHIVERGEKFCSPGCANS